MWRQDGGNFWTPQNGHTIPLLPHICMDEGAWREHVPPWGGIYFLEEEQVYSSGKMLLYGRFGAKFVQVMGDEVQMVVGSLGGGRWHHAQCLGATQ